MRLAGGAGEGNACEGGRLIMSEQTDWPDDRPWHVRARCVEHTAYANLEDFWPMRTKVEAKGAEPPCDFRELKNIRFEMDDGIPLVVLARCVGIEALAEGGHRITFDWAMGQCVLVRPGSDVLIRMAGEGGYQSAHNFGPERVITQGSAD